MSFRDEFFRTRDGREYTVHYGGPLRDKVLGMSVEDVYRTQPELQAVVSFIARNVAQLPLKCYTRVSDDDRPRDTEGVLPKLLADPGGGVTTYDLVLWTISDICIYGRYLWWVLPSADTESGWVIQHIPAGWIMQTKTRDGFRPSTYVLRNPTTISREIEVPADQFVSHVEYNPGMPVTPLSPVEALKQVLAEQASSREYRNKVWRNGGWFSRWIKRPKDAPDWSKDGGRARFARSWKSKFAGKDGTDTGGTPLLEDGMELVETRLNAKEAEWAESMRLSREDVAAAYHVNPAQVWSNDGQTYASVKENARSLDSDTLGPYLAMMRADIERRLVPIIGADPRSYAEFDLAAKLAGSFEEQASFLSQSTGGPWMLRNEARARMNLPAVEGGDELIVPMNVTEGGLANPHDTAPDKGARPVGYAGDGVVHALPGAKGEPKARKKAGDRSREPRTTVLKSRGEPDEDAVREITRALAKFAGRQGKRVLSDLPPLDGDKPDDDSSGDGGDPEWWNGERWDRELADDLTPILQREATMRAIATLADLGLPPSTYDVARTVNFVRSMAESRARAYNQVTLRQLEAVCDGSAPEGKGSTPEGVFEMAASSRAERSGVSFATSAASFGTTEAARQAYPKDTDEARRYKVWRHRPSDHPRASHARMDGERVGLDEKFSNGADWPGDHALGPTETCNCHCQVEIEVEKRERGKETLEGLTVRDSNSPLMQAETFEELEDMCVERLDGAFARGVTDMDLASVKMLVSGIDDVATQFGVQGQFLTELAVKRIKSGTIAMTGDNGVVTINSSYFGKGLEAAVSVGRHEAGHLLEVLASDGDSDRFDSAKDAKRILNRAFRNYKRDNPDLTQRLEGVISEITLTPSWAVARTGKKPLLYSEGLAEIVERAADDSVTSDSFITYVIESMREELS
ncbi:MAG: phage portal protein [Atopobiaceae bacterium]|nr:phage portal protein [Atopobiaceae bacterium]